MRRRTTFISDPSIEFDPSSVEITSSRFFIPSIKAAREEQLKYSLDELPTELQSFLADARELHARWTTQQNYNLSAPYTTRAAPGLQVFYTPGSATRDADSEGLLCRALHELFAPSAKCHAPDTSFTKADVLESEFKTTPALQYHATLPNLDHFVVYLQRTFCPGSSLLCIHSTSLLSTADYLDISWSAITQSLTVSAFWSRPPSSLIDPASQHKTTDAWSLSLDIPSATSQTRVEVGILSPEAITADPQDLTLSGFLTVLGTDTKPKPTRFSFPSRHHIFPAAASSNYHASIQQPQGLHPTLKITLPHLRALQQQQITIPSAAQCTPQVHLTLPSHTFVDPYSLKISDPNFRSTYHIQAVHSLTGHLDLEAPDYIPSSPWGSSLLFTPTLPELDADLTSPWEVTVPLHLRYLPHSNATSHEQVTLPYPVVYFACPAEADSAAKFPVNPFDRVHLGYDGLYGPLTTFFHLNPQPEPTAMGSDKLTLTLSVPVLQTGVTLTPYAIELVTLLAISVGFLWITAKLWLGLKRELGSYIPETVETTKPITKEWEQPVSGPGFDAGSLRRRG
ncbi:Protein pbn1 [Cyphellophora attinorum]|uniref:Protein PBN1 n=1 Tax=Cyphellophora attinorum TaxID=1664694 RepID=A0A0N1P1C9_9EURO|nr:Protein pbn1 [Phialophora attinorum]KPI41586.1 Protein pbn1 [Phialophora attinorum]